MTSSGLEIPPDQKASQILSIWLRSGPVSMWVPPRFVARGKVSSTATTVARTRSRWGPHARSGRAVRQHDANLVAHSEFRALGIGVIWEPGHVTSAAAMPVGRDDLRSS